MKVGDLVLCGTEETLGIIVRFDEDGDPVIHQSHNGVVCAHWKQHVKVIQ